MNTLHIGVLLFRPKALGISHVGVWMGGGAVFHNAPSRGEHVSSAHEFANGEQVKIESTNVDPITVTQRIQSKLANPRGYDLISNNCEHAANHVVTGRAYSDQLRLATLLIGLGILYFALRKR